MAVIDDQRNAALAGIRDKFQNDPVFTRNALSRATPQQLQVLVDEAEGYPEVQKVARELLAAPGGGGGIQGPGTLVAQAATGTMTDGVPSGAELKAMIGGGTLSGEGSAGSAPSGADLKALLSGQRDEFGADTSPIELPDPRVERDGLIVDRQEVPGAEGMFTMPPGFSDTERRAAQAGVVFDKPAPAGQFLAGFAFNEEERLAAYGQELAQAYGREIPVRAGEATGEVEFLDPETNRWTIANPGTLGAVEGMAGPAVVLAPEIVLGGVAAVVAKHPTVVELGAGAGAFVGELARYKIGRDLGINQSVELDQAVAEAAKTAGITAAAGIGADRLLRVGKLVFGMLDGSGQAKRALAELGPESFEQAAKIQQEVNDIIGPEKLRFTLAQSTNDEELLMAADQLSKSRLFARQFGNFEDRQNAALREFYDTVTNRFRSRLSENQYGGSTRAAVQAVQNALDSDFRLQRRVLDQPVGEMQRELDRAVSGIPTMPAESFGAILRDVGSREQEAFRQEAEKLAGNLRAMASGAAFIPNRETVAAVEELRSSADANLLPFLAQRIRKVLGDAGTEGSVAKIFDPEAEFTFDEAWTTLSGLKTYVRENSYGLSTADADVGAAKKLIGALQRDLDAGMQGSALREEYTRFTQWYAAEKQRLDEGAVANAMRKNGTGDKARFVVADESVFNKIVLPRKNPRSAREVWALIKNDPQAVRGVREAIGDFYRRTVVGDDGRVNLERHKRFLEDYGAALGVYFTRDEAKAIAKPAGIEAALRAREKARDEALERINKSFETQVRTLDNPGKLVPLVLDPKNPEKARDLMASLERVPEVKRALQAEVSKTIAERIAGEFKGGERVLSLPKLADFLNGKSGETGHRQVLTAIYGEPYVKNLDTLLDAMSIARRAPKARAVGSSPMLANLVRAYVGVFTQAGRFVTAASRIRGKAANRALVKAILDPPTLEQVLKLKDKPMTDEKVVGLLSALGATAAMEDYQ